MVRLGVPNRFIVVCVAILVYAVVVTFKIFSSDVTCRPTVCPSSVCNSSVEEKHVTEVTNAPPWEQHLDFKGFDNETGTPDGHYIVPNYVHFVKFGQAEFSFVHTVCILAALKNQKPEKLFIHTDLNGFRGKYWNVMMNTTGFKEVLVIKKMKVPTEIFGQKLQQKWRNYHGGDVARLQIMMKYGGIYLDSDSYVVRSLNDFRRYEMTLGWFPGKDMGNQILLAHKDARFLRLWYESYRDNYDPTSWYYNAGTYPTNILVDKPYLVHRVEKLFGNYGIKWKTYMTNFPEWRDYYTFHLLSSRLNRGLKNLSKTLKYPVVFNDVNILKYPVAFRDMCKAVYPFPKGRINENTYSI
ncbi:uncharacterized protein LOC124363975 [Homalodisca vitripennis]|uniref:uncharacterized protein LOC124363975 n=1 Tax=Homalodisca vitripennis TaxID=197043 RepID=UPI001EEADC08|nr:uncharacterized protein LOC124363975 [Homalodisca vitripennis]